MSVEEAEQELSDAEARLGRVRQRQTLTVQGIAEAEAELEATGAERREALHRAADGHDVNGALAGIKQRRDAATDRRSELAEQAEILREQLREAERDHARAQAALQHARGEAVLTRARIQADRCNLLGGQYASSLTELWALSEEARRLLGLTDGRTMWESGYGRALRSANLLEERTREVHMPLVEIG